MLAINNNEGNIVIQKKTKKLLSDSEGYMSLCDVQAAKTAALPLQKIVTGMSF